MHGVCAQEAAERNEFAAASDTRRPWVQTVVLLPWPAGEGHWAVQAVAHEGAEHYCYSPTSRAPVQKVFNIREVGEGGGGAQWAAESCGNQMVIKLPQQYAMHVAKWHSPRGLAAWRWTCSSRRHRGHACWGGQTRAHCNLEVDNGGAGR